MLGATSPFLQLCFVAIPQNLINSVIISDNFICFLFLQTFLFWLLIDQNLVREVVQ